MENVCGKHKLFKENVCGKHKVILPLQQKINVSLKN